MKIKRSRRREWARLLVRVLAIAFLVVCAAFSIRLHRVEGDEQAPAYKDGDLVMMWRSDDTPFLQLRVRGFDD